MKDSTTGAVSYDAENHELMVQTRAEKLARVARMIPPTEVHGDPEGDLLVVGWGSTHGVIHEAVTMVRSAGKRVGSVHLRYLNPLPPDLGDIVRRFKKIVVPELNLGQLNKVLRSTYLVDAKSITKVQGRPFKVTELVAAFKAHLDGAA